jgi:hypothetical protein
MDVLPLIGFDYCDFIAVFSGWFSLNALFQKEKQNCDVEPETPPNPKGRLPNTRCQTDRLLVEGYELGPAVVSISMRAAINHAAKRQRL